MKKNLLLVILLCCFAGVALAENPLTHNKMTIQNVISSISTKNSLSYTDLTKSHSLNSIEWMSRRNKCDNTNTTPPDDHTPVDPPCVDLDDGEEDGPIGGNTQKDYFLLERNYVARYYRYYNENNFVFYEERSVEVNRLGVEPGEENKPGEDGTGFEIHIPNPFQVSNNYGYYRVEIIEVGSLEPPLAIAYVDVYFPNFEEFPQFP